MQKQATISSQMIRHIKKYILDLDKNFEEICSLTGIPASSDVFHDPNARLDAENFLHLFQEAEKACKNPQFGLNLGKAMAQNYPGGSIIMGMMTNSPTTGAALDIFFRYHDLMANALRPCMVLEDDIVKMGWERGDSRFNLPRQITDMLLSLFFGILEIIGDGRIELYKVRFSYPEPENTGPYRERFRAPLEFDQPESEIHFEAQFLSLPVFWADAALLETFESYARKQIHRIFFSDTWAQKVAEIISEKLTRAEQFGLGDIAEGIGVSKRSLQEKLKEEGTSYRNILAEVRQQMALSCLKAGGEINLCDIAFLLGFSEQSAFNRAFKRWTGRSPKAYLSEK